jgi:hypothetical protein
MQAAMMRGRVGTYLPKSVLKARRSICAGALLAITLAAPPLAQAEGEVPFAISVDGQRIDGSVLPPPAPGAEHGALDIQVKFDGLGITPMLNVSTVPPRVSFYGGEEIKFLTRFNYGAWLDHGEVLIYARRKLSGSNIYQRIPIAPDGTAVWTLPEDSPAELHYVLRVYDSEGKYDETQPLPLNRVEREDAIHDRGEVATAPGYSEDRTAFRNIDVSGGAVTVHGKNVPEGHLVYVAGEHVPVDPEGAFVVQRVFPPGTHNVAIKVERDGEGIDFSRAVTIPESEWFYVGLADFTAGHRWGERIEEAGEENTFTRGRLAFYLKGKIKGRWILTAAADTSDQQLKNIFKGLDDKDPREFLKRIDPDDYYPVYGDDSTFTEDAPTQGKFYVKLQKGASHAMWGNFRSNITGSKFLRSERALYGAQAAYRGGAATPDGGHTKALDVHAALPGTLPNRQSFRGTGGSAYFLRHQDVTPGSDTVAIEVRNATTGWVLERRRLTYGTDYDFDFMQGVILLRTPLPSSSSAGTENYLVVSYEYTPAGEDVDGYVVAGRAQQWFGKHVRVGVTGMKENTETADQKMYGADIHVRHSEGTYIEGEVARSEGPGFSTTYSPDGGLTNQDTPSAGILNKKADAFRVEGRVDLFEVSDGTITGSIGARYEHYQKGFSSLDINADTKQTLWGADASVEVSKRVNVGASFSDEKQGNGTHDQNGKAKIAIDAGEHVLLEPYLDHTIRDKGTTATATTQEGKRTDTGARIIYKWKEDVLTYVLGQVTADRSGTMYDNDRYGVGGKAKLTEKVSAEGEVSDGDQGIGASARINYDPTADDSYYVGYQLDPLRDLAGSWPFTLAGVDAGSVVAGARSRINEQWSTYGEDSYDMFGERRSLTQAYGVTYTPTAAWTITGAAEVGQVFDDTVDPGTGLKNPDFDRRAFSLAAGFKDEGWDGHLKGEWRDDDSEDDSRDMQAYLMRASVGVKVEEDWRAQAGLDVVWTDATDSTRESKYAEGSLGLAYRPIASDRLNALFKYTFLYDNPGTGQVGVDGTTSSPAQRSHILSGDAIYDLIPQLSFGAKYGFRIGETKEKAAGADWEESDAHLAILRADWHVLSEWDAIIEGRALWSPTADQTDFGLVAAIHRHVSETLKLGVGYNFGRFSDDLADLTHDDEGVFLNLIGKF